MNIPLESQAAQTLSHTQPVDWTYRLLRRARVWMASVLMLSDLLTLTLSGLLAVGLRRLLGFLPEFHAFDPTDYARFSALALLFLFLYYIRGLYPAVGMGAVEEFRRLVINTSLGFLSVATFTFAIQAPPIYSRLTFMLTWMFALVLVPLGRTFVRAVCARMGVWGEPVVIVGERASAVELAVLLRRFPKIGMAPALVCAHGTCPAALGREALAQPGRGFRPECAGCPARHARTALAVYDDYNQLEAVREKYLDTFERIILVNNHDSGLNLSSVSVREFGGLAGLEIRQNLLNRWAQAQKRCIDLIGSAVGILLLSPFLLIVAALIYLDSPGRIFYRQVRMGKGGRKFNLLKFRTMQLNADEYLRAHLEKHPELQREWDQYQKLKKDPRITRVGGLLRRFSIDELPQLWNVFTGEMSLVGPRPMMVNQVEMYGKPYDHYVRVTPGITGLWQVSGRNRTTFARRAELDVYYVMNWSIWMDLYLLVRTVWVVLRRDGAA